MKKINLLLALLLVPIHLSFAYKDSLVVKKPIVAIQVKDSLTFNEGKAYKLLYDNQVKSNDAILKTIFYALGGLGSAVLLVFASNWWFNDKKVRDLINEIDSKIKGANKDAFAESNDKIRKFSSEKSTEINLLQIKLQEEATKNIKELTFKINEFKEKIREEIKEDNNVLLNNYQKQLESFNENYRQQISSLNENINSMIKNLKENLDAKEEMLKSLIETEKQRTASDLNFIRSNVSRVEYYLWDTKGIQRNAFIAQIAEIEYMFASLSGKTFDYTFYLKQLDKTAEKLVLLLEGDKERTKAILTSLPEKYQPSAQEIINKLEKISIFDPNRPNS